VRALITMLASAKKVFYSKKQRSIILSADPAGQPYSPGGIATKMDLKTT